MVNRSLLDTQTIWWVILVLLVWNDMRMSKLSIFSFRWTIPLSYGIFCFFSRHCNWFVVVGEPSPPILEGTLHSKGNALKVKWTKQDDGGSPITHYLVRYKPVSVQNK